MQRDALQEITKRTQRYWYEDGIWEIGFGLVNGLLGGFYYLTGRLDWSGPLALVLMLIQVAVLVSIFLFMNRFVRWMKEHITYPRTGYVAYIKPQGRKRLKRFFLVAGLAAGVAAFTSALGSLAGMENRMPLVTSLIIAAALVFVGYRFDLLRWYLLGGLSIGLGYAISISNLRDLLSTAAFFAGYGLLLLVSGLITLAVYLVRTRAASGDGFEPELPGQPDQDQYPRQE